MALSAAVREGRAKPALIVAMPVGFVAVTESKQQALALPVPAITVVGRKGGSALAAATVNALHAHGSRRKAVMAVEPLVVVGVGQDGLEGLSAEARAHLERAEILAGSKRQLALFPNSTAKRLLLEGDPDSLDS